MIPITRSIVSMATKGVPTLKGGYGFLLEFGFSVSKGRVANWSADSSTIGSHDALHKIVHYLKDKIGVVYFQCCVIFDTL